CSILFFVCFQAEDGIRVGHVTGVQTCALPIWCDTSARRASALAVPSSFLLGYPTTVQRAHSPFEPKYHTDEPAAFVQDDWRATRSEERRVGKECRAWVAT